MKKIAIGALVGGILIFLVQFLSWALFDLHRPYTQYTPKQDEILGFLNQQFDSDGSYMVPNLPADATSEDMERHMKDAAGKPWAIVSYHKSQEASMGMNMFRGFVVDIIMVGLFCYIISAFANPRMGNIFLASLFVGLISFLAFPYTEHIWFDTFDLGANLFDALAGWGLVGLWLGWWYGRTPKVNVVVR